MEREKFDKIINELLTKVQKLIPTENPDQNVINIALKAPEWLEFEYKIWNIGENIRKNILRANRKLDETQIQKILEICKNSNAKKGRQSFVMLLGKTAYKNHAQELIALLNEEEINGYIVSTIYKMKAVGYKNEIAPFLNSSNVWVRNIAKKYFELNI